MNFRIKRIGSLLASAAMVSAPALQQVGSVLTTRVVAGGAIASGLAVMSGAAHAQKNKRMCARVWQSRSGTAAGVVAIGVEVNKYDLVTCLGLHASWAVLTAVPGSVAALARDVFNNASGVGSGLSGRMVAMQTCEDFSRDMRANRGDVCLSMTDYKLYAFAHGDRGFVMGNIKL